MQCCESNVESVYKKIHLKFVDVLFLTGLILQLHVTYKYIFVKAARSDFRIQTRESITCSADHTKSMN